MFCFTCANCWTVFSQKFWVEWQRAGRPPEILLCLLLSLFLPLTKTFWILSFLSSLDLKVLWAVWADAFYKSKCLWVCLFVCLSVRRTFSLRLTVFLPPLPEVQCPKCLDFQKSLGKNNGRKWSQIWKLLLKFFFYRFFFICSLRLNVYLPLFPKSNVQTI